MTKLGGGIDVASLAEAVPLRRLGRTWDIGMACVFLASSAATFISGETLVVDGGAWLWKPLLFPRESVAALSKALEKPSRATGLAAKL